MNNGIKLVALDMDGTSFIKAGGIVTLNIEPIKKVEELGIKVVFITGRPIKSIQNNDIFKYGMVKDDTLMSAFNGALIKKLSTNEILFKKIIDKKIVEKAFLLSKKYKNDEVSLWCYFEDEENVLINKTLENDACFIGENRFFSGTISIVNENTKFKNSLKFICNTSNQKFLDDLKSLGLSCFGELNKNCEVVANGASKMHALEFISKHWNIKNSEMLSIGDAENDIPMLNYTKYSYAPNNASESVKRIAKNVCKTDYQDGAVGEILNDLIIKEKN